MYNRKSDAPLPPSKSELGVSEGGVLPIQLRRITPLLHMLPYTASFLLTTSRPTPTLPLPLNGQILHRNLLVSAATTIVTRPMTRALGRVNVDVVSPGQLSFSG